MQSIKLTPSQQAAVENEGGALLVAAAAGSGKTKVLVDRLMRSILDPVHPKNVDDFLIITYTKAAAAELGLKSPQSCPDRWRYSRITAIYSDRCDAFIRQRFPLFTHSVRIF